MCRRSTITFVRTPSGSRSRLQRCRLASSPNRSKQRLGSRRQHCCTSWRTSATRTRCGARCTRQSRSTCRCRTRSQSSGTGRRSYSMCCCLVVDTHEKKEGGSAMIMTMPNQAHAGTLMHVSSPGLPCTGRRRHMCMNARTHERSPDPTRPPPACALSAHRHRLR